MAEKTTVKPFSGVPSLPILKTMDGGYLEAEMMAKEALPHVVGDKRAQKKRLNAR